MRRHKIPKLKTEAQALDFIRYRPGLVICRQANWRRRPVILHREFPRIPQARLTELVFQQLKKHPDIEYTSRAGAADWDAWQWRIQRTRTQDDILADCQQLIREHEELLIKFKHGVVSYSSILNHLPAAITTIQTVRRHLMILRYPARGPDLTEVKYLESITTKEYSPTA